MAAYYTTLIYGNEDFGGYLSVDGEKSFPIAHDMTYPIDPGPHRFEIFTTSDFQRAAGNLQATLYANTSSSGAILDYIERNQALKNIGDGWQIDCFVEENQTVYLSVRSNGKNIVAAPSYEVADLTDEQIAMLEDAFAQMEEDCIREEEERIRREEELKRTPRRSVPKIIVGSILAGIGALETPMFLLEGLLGEQYQMLAASVVTASMLIFGLILLLSGLRKKIRG